jgi:5-methylcytosine-specific restriction endonuclease McrA
MKCGRCKAEALAGASLCPVHIVRARIWAWSQQRPSCKIYMPRSLQKGRKGSDPLAVIAKDLLNLLDQQKHTCALSGKPIALGVNAEVDHIEPIALRPEKAFTLDNLRWVDATVNKRNTKGAPKKTNVGDEQKLLNALTAVQHQAINWKICDQELVKIWRQIEGLISLYGATKEKH